MHNYLDDACGIDLMGLEGYTGDRSHHSRLSTETCDFDFNIIMSKDVRRLYERLTDKNDEADLKAFMKDAKKIARRKSINRPLIYPNDELFILIKSKWGKKIAKWRIESMEELIERLFY